MEYKSSQITSQSWYFTDLSDSRLNIVPESNVSVDTNNTNRIIIGGNGEVMPNGDIRTLFEVFTNTPYNETRVAQDHIQFKAQRAIMNETDWTNFEVTLYGEFINVTPKSEITIYGRSGRHIMGRPCEGTFYRMTIRVDGFIKCEAKYWHPGGLKIINTPGNILGDLEGERIGIKFVVFTNKDGETTTIRGMVDINGDNTWTEVCYVIDTGELNTLAYQKCGDETTKIITWGGPIIGVEIKNFPTSLLEPECFAIDKFSIREIDALSPKVEIPVPAAPFDPEAVSPPTAPPSTGYRTDLTDLYDDDIYELPTWGDPGDNPPPP